MALAALLALAAGSYAWNAASQPAFWGYDEGAHAAYALSILERGRLPHPLSGWSSFHPPLSYLFGAALWSAFEPLGGRVTLFALRLPSLLGALAIGLAVQRLALRIGASPVVAVTASALALFLPVSQLAASMVGNEALAAGLAALALPPLLDLQRDPGDRPAALGVGLLAGLALATKYTGAWLAVAALTPYLRGGLDRRALAALAAMAACVLAIAGPVYARNLAITGTPLPFTRSLEPMKQLEERLLVRPRRLSDYAGVSWRCGQHPYVTRLAPDGRIAGASPAMLNVPCLTYAGLWFDPFGIRAARRPGAEGLGWGRALLLLGVAPTLLVLLGFGRAAVEVVRSRGRCQESPLVASTLLGLASYAAFTWLAPSLAAAKASYLLPLIAPAGAFFARGCGLLGPRARAGALLASAAAVALAAVVFTTGLVFPAADPDAARSYWGAIGAALPQSYISEATQRLLGGG